MKKLSLLVLTFLFITPIIAVAQEAAVETGTALVAPETVLSFINFILGIPVIGSYLPIILAIVTVASSVAALTPTPKAGTIWATLYKVLIDLPALNVFKAKDTGTKK